MIMQFWLYLSDMGCEISVQRSQRVAIPLLEQLLDALLPHLRRHVARRSIVAHFAMLGSLRRENRHPARYHGRS